MKKMLSILAITVFCFTFVPVAHAADATATKKSETGKSAKPKKAKQVYTKMEWLHRGVDPIWNQKTSKDFYVQALADAIKANQREKIFERIWAAYSFAANHTNPEYRTTLPKEVLKQFTDTLRYQPEVLEEVVIKKDDFFNEMLFGWVVPHFAMNVRVGFTDEAQCLMLSIPYEGKDYKLYLPYDCSNLAWNKIGPTDIPPSIPPPLIPPPIPPPPVTTHKEPKNTITTGVEVRASTKVTDDLGTGSPELTSWIAFVTYERLFNLTPAAQTPLMLKPYVRVGYEKVEERPSQVYDTDWLEGNIGGRFQPMAGLMLSYGHFKAQAEYEVAKKDDVQNDWLRFIATYEGPGFPYIQARTEKGNFSGPDGSPDGEGSSWEFKLGIQPLRYILRKKPNKFDPVIYVNTRHEEFSRDGRSIQIDSAPVGFGAEAWVPIKRETYFDPTTNTTHVKREWNLNGGFRGGLHDVRITNPEGSSEFEAWLWDGWLGAQLKWGF